jgi:hypothetical protein
MLLAVLLAATVQGPADVESLTASSDAVVHARVARLASAWAPGGRQIFTAVTLQTIESWKGASAEEVQILVPGGEVGEIAQTVQGVASFREGEEVVVFLHRIAPSAFAVERMALGKFAIGTPAGLARRATRDRRGLTCTGCGPGEFDDLSLDELRARVLGSVRR